MNITMTLEGDSTERLVQTVCAVIGGAQAGAAAPAQPAVPAPEKARAYKAPEPEVVNDGKAAQKDVLAVFEAHGSKYLRSIDEAEYPAVLAELEAL